jgi:response regulator NasT
MADRIRVLVAEDEFIISLSLKTLLTEMGHEVVATARDGAQAVQHCVTHRPDLVLMDIGMPTVDGITATREIMARCPTPIVVLSAYNDRDRVANALEAGAVAYLLKPIVEGELRAAIAQVIGLPEE